MSTKFRVFLKLRGRDYESRACRRESMQNGPRNSKKRDFYNFANISYGFRFQKSIISKFHFSVLTVEQLQPEIGCRVQEIGLTRTLIEPDPG